MRDQEQPPDVPETDTRADVHRHIANGHVMVATTLPSFGATNTDPVHVAWREVAEPHDTGRPLVEHRCKLEQGVDGSIG